MVCAALAEVRFAATMAAMRNLIADADIFFMRQCPGKEM